MDPRNNKGFKNIATTIGQVIKLPFYNIMMWVNGDVSFYWGGIAKKSLTKLNVESRTAQYIIDERILFFTAVL